MHDFMTERPVALCHADSATLLHIVVPSYVSEIVS